MATHDDDPFDDGRGGEQWCAGDAAHIPGNDDAEDEDDPEATAAIEAANAREAKRQAEHRASIAAERAARRAERARPRTEDELRQASERWAKAMQAGADLDAANIALQIELRTCAAWLTGRDETVARLALAAKTARERLTEAVAALAGSGGVLGAGDVRPAHESPHIRPVDVRRLEVLLGATADALAIVQGKFDRVANMQAFIEGVRLLDDRDTPPPVVMR